MDECKGMTSLFKYFQVSTAANTNKTDEVVVEWILYKFIPLAPYFTFPEWDQSITFLTIHFIKFNLGSVVVRSPCAVYITSNIN